MQVFKIFLILLCFESISCKISTDKKQVMEKTTDFVVNLLEDLNSMEHEDDVALLRFSLYKVSKNKVMDSFDSIISRLMKENVVLTPKLHEMHLSSKIKTAKIVIIISDVTDPVSFILLKNIRLQFVFEILKHNILIELSTSLFQQRKFFEILE